jgi:hypothetical protein
MFDIHGSIHLGNTGLNEIPTRCILFICLFICRLYTFRATPIFRSFKCTLQTIGMCTLWITKMNINRLCGAMRVFSGYVFLCFLWFGWCFCVCWICFCGGWFAVGRNVCVLFLFVLTVLMCYSIGSGIGFGTPSHFRHSQI